MNDIMGWSWAQGHPDLSGLERAELEALIRGTRPSRASTRRQVFRWIWQRGVTRFRRHDRSQPRASRPACRAGHYRVAINRQPGRLRGRHPEVRPVTGRRPPHRIGLHPRYAGADVLHLHAGWVRDGLRLLPDRQDGADSSPVGCGDRRAGSRPCWNTPASRALQHRSDGYGRAAPQLRRDDESAANPVRRGRAGAAAASHHAVDGRTGTRCSIGWHRNR